MRVARHMGARTVTEDDATVLAIIPIFPGETIQYLNMDCYAVALSDEDVSNPLEMNWYGLGLSWEHALTSQAIAAALLAAPLTNVAAWDGVYEQMLLDTSQDGAEYYGGDVDADPETLTGEEAHTVGDEELIDSGPTGPYRWFKREILSRTHVAAGNATTRGGDEFRSSPGSKVRNMSATQILMFGMVRHDVAAETNFNLEMDDVTSIQAMALLTMGDYAKVQSRVQGDTGAVGDWMRTVLYGGDSYIEASTLKTGNVKAYCKIEVGMNGPLDRLSTR